ncbi:hypothetical protein HRUBRA_01466 [Pseudohaliea rubra DSM 19751]|uniref:Uncharacterized protein n=1 Tax=Pseudohaliea rubra DSM 19751 TaxID=1265313 RepID=A0A095XW89_9GAMM|nr:hypothetical protein HRUBRA_01466 [Pseudohaliea rubra DSM 19751]
MSRGVRCNGFDRRLNPRTIRFPVTVNGRIPREDRRRRP